MGDTPTGRRSRRASAPLLIAEIGGVILLVYAIAQPGLLRIFHVRQGEDLSIADVISILATVLGLFAASIGFLVYILAKSRLEDTNRYAVQQARMSAAHNGAVLAWTQLEPLLTEPFEPSATSSGRDELRRDSCLRCLEVGKQASQGAKKSWEQSGPDFEDKAYWHDLIWITRAFLLACDIYVRGAGPNDQAAIEALNLLSQVRVIDDPESAAWVQLLCNRKETGEWSKGRELAIRSVDPEQDPLTRRRYEAAFGTHFFP